MKKDAMVLFITPGSMIGMPSNRRVDSFADFFSLNGFKVQNWGNLSFKDKMFALLKSELIFLSMPPFRFWWLLLFFGYKLLIDWRDGWSVSMKTGYGNTVPPQKIKSIFARGIELFSIIMAKKIVVCTQGLYLYHTKHISSKYAKKITIITNGHDLPINSDAFSDHELLEKSEIKAICIGKFAEYGNDKALMAINTLLERYPKATFKLQLIGANEEENLPVLEKASKSCRISISFEDRIPYDEVIERLKSADLAIAIIRDQSYDYGTKVFDYIACGKPILNIFEPSSNFRKFFSGCFDDDYDREIAFKKAKETIRKDQIGQSILC